MSDRITDGKLTPMDDLLESVAGGDQFRTRLRLLRLQDLWRESVGPALAAASAPSALERGRLTIVVTNSTWNMTLRSMEKRLLDRFQKLAPELDIRSLRVEIGSLAPPVATTASAPHETPKDYPAASALDEVNLSSSAQRGIRDAAAAIEDDDLRDRFSKAMQRAQQLRHWRLQHGWTIDGRNGDLVPPTAAPKRQPPAPAPPGRGPYRAPGGPRR